MMGVAATGKAIVVTGITIYRIGDGKIQEAWDYFDVRGLMQQLGVCPLLGKGIGSRRNPLGSILIRSP
jgi:hypothetical protein